MSDTLHIASGPDTQTYTPYQLLAGDTPLVATAPDTLASGQNLAQNTVVARITASGLLTVLTPGAATGAEIAVGILAYAVDASGGNSACVIYKAGCFNAAALVWPAAIDTLAERQAAFDKSPIVIKNLRYSG